MRQNSVLGHILWAIDTQNLGLFKKNLLNGGSLENGQFFFIGPPINTFVIVIQYCVSKNFFLGVDHLLSVNIDLDSKKSACKETIA